MPFQNSWIEISRSAIKHNLKFFRKIIGPKIKLLIPVKANAYGHGLVEVANLVSKNDAQFLGVNSLAEAEILRQNKLIKPILILGYVKLADLKKLVSLKKISLVVYNLETIKKLGQLKKSINIHLKLETGTARQGIDPANILEFIQQVKKYPFIKIEGLYTHFANIEDSYGFAFQQLQVFKKTVALLNKHKIKIPIKHTACSAATILYKQTHFDMVRPGISIYGLWSSRETRLTLEKHNKQFLLKPVLAWKTIVAQIKFVKKSQPVGYGCTEKVFRDSKIAVIPVGYWDGFDRGLSSIGNVLIRSQRAKVLGRVCMNMFMVDVTDIKTVKVEDEVVLIGRQGREEITVDEVACKLGTINYEVVTRINPLLKRRVVK